MFVQSVKGDIEEISGSESDSTGSIFWSTVIDVKQWLGQ